MISRMPKQTCPNCHKNSARPVFRKKKASRIYSWIFILALLTSSLSMFTEPDDGLLFSIGAGATLVWMSMGFGLVAWQAYAPSQKYKCKNCKHEFEREAAPMSVGTKIFYGVAVLTILGIIGFVLAVLLYFKLQERIG